MIMIMVIDIPIGICPQFQFKFQDVRHKFSCLKNMHYCPCSRLADVPIIILKHRVYTVCAVLGFEHFA